MSEKHYETKILVVDDEKFVRTVICAKLKSAGYDSVAVENVEKAIAILKEAPHSFSAIISDIMMGEMDGFVFRDVVRGINAKIPFFFLTALDPEEGSGFLRRIMDDPISYYLPKAVGTEMLINRVRQVIASHRVESFIQNKIEEDRKSLELASHIQRSLLPLESMKKPRGFYSLYFRPLDIVSGDLFEAVPFGERSYLYVLGDIQGHGTSAALAMTAVQSFLKNFAQSDGDDKGTSLGPEDIANMLQKFFRKNLADITYMTADICIHSPLKGKVRWISCGAPDIIVMDNGKDQPVNPERRGGVPIGLFPDTVYTAKDVVETPLSSTAVYLAYTDGLLDLSRDAEGDDRMPLSLSKEIRSGIIEAARRDGTCMVAAAKFMKALAELGYNKLHDDITLLMFGESIELPGIYEATIRLLPQEIDGLSQKVAAWCREQGWPDEGIMRLQLVLEEKLMNVYDHGIDERDKMHEVTSIRVKRIRDNAVLTVWDPGSPEPSIVVAAGDSDAAFEMANQNMAGRGRGRLIVREICDGIERSSYPPLNETTYHIPLAGKNSSTCEGGGSCLKEKEPKKNESMLQGVS